MLVQKYGMEGSVHRMRVEPAAAGKGKGAIRARRWSERMNAHNTHRSHSPFGYQAHPAVGSWSLLAHPLPLPGSNTIIMNKGIAIVLLIAGLVIIGFGLLRKDEGQAEIDLGKAEITLGKPDSAFNGYFVVGGVAAAAGLVLLAMKRKG